MSSNKISKYCVINNIPEENRTIDLRYFFSDFIETNKFKIFHFKNRPQNTTIYKTNDNTKCCIVKLKKRKYVTEFIKQYHNKRWYNYSKSCERKPTPLNTTCMIVKIQEPKCWLDCSNVPTMKKYMTRKEKREFYSKYQNINFIPELHPPKGLKYGNVGTPSREIIEMINQCKLPSSLLKNLGIDYKPPPNEFGKVSLNYDNIEEKYISNIDDDEEWEIYEPEYKPILYEQPVEKCWDKGDNSGLCIYTDDFYWESKKDEEPDVEGFDVAINIMHKFGWKEGEGIGKKPGRNIEPLSDKLTYSCSDKKRKNERFGLGYNNKKKKQKTESKIYLKVDPNTWHKPIQLTKWVNGGLLKK